MTTTTMARPGFDRAKAARSATLAQTRGPSMAAANFWHTLQSVMGQDPPERARQIAADAVLVRILADRGIIDECDAANAAQYRDRSGMLLEHVLHTRFGVPMDDLLAALGERRAITRKANT